jgi:diguanylate cyclase (GGDEF)-like protein
MIRYLILFFFTALILFATPQKSVTLHYLQDIQSQYTLEDIQKAHFSNKLPTRFSLGYHHADTTHWFKLELTNHTKLHTLLLYFTNHYAKEFSFYYQDHNGRWVADEQGYINIERFQTITLNNPLLKLPIEPQRTKVVYIKIKSEFAIFGEFLLFKNKSDLWEHQKSYYQFFAFFYGALFATIGVNLFLFVTLRSRLYGYYVGYLIFFGFFVFTVNSLFSYFSAPWAIGILHSLVPLASLFFILFIGEILNFKEIAPRLKRVLDLFKIMLFFLFIMINVSISPWYRLLNLSGGPIYLLLLSATIFAVYQGVKRAKLYLVVLLFFIIAIALMVHMYDGLLENNDINQYSFMVISIIEFVVFTIILANKINEESAQKLTIEEKLRTQQEQYALKLEDEVHQRTQELEMLNKKLLGIATTDQLTQLCNRVGLDSKLEKVWQEYREHKVPFGVALIDIDNFKKVNDTYGHQVGDLVLQAIGKILKSKTSKECFIGRWGGEEFLIIFQTNSLTSLYNLAEIIRNEIEGYNYQEIKRVTASFGITLVNQHDSRIESSISRADSRLYDAKHAGRNCIMPRV